MQKMNIKYLFIFLISWLSLTLFFSVLAIDLMDYSTFFFLCAIAFLLSFVTLWAVWQSDKNAKDAIKKATEDTKKQEETEKERQKEEEKQKRNKAKDAEWAKRMAEIRKQKKIERLQQIEKEQQYYMELSSSFELLGAKLECNKNGCAEIFKIETNEKVSIRNLMTLIDNIGKNYDEHRLLFNTTKVCCIYDLSRCELIKMEYTRNFIYVTFTKESSEAKVFDYKKNRKDVENLLFCYLENRKIKRLENSLDTIIQNGFGQVPSIVAKGISLEERVCSALQCSNYDIDFRKEIECSKEKDMLVVDYELPNKSNLLEVKEYKYITSSKEISTKRFTESYIAKRYENVLYSITLRSLYEIFSIDTKNEINGVTFNGFVTQVNPANGIIERKCILSLQVNKEKFSQINLAQVEPKACFKALKGVSAAKLIDVSPVTPILTFNKKDKRFVEGKDVSVNQGTNLAAMHWEDFEHLVRELFEMEFARNGGEVRVTQASRDGGVDAIVFDPDPLRGGKIVIQAKRYTNTVGVSAVRDLYGTVINEGANSGILITTSDYGHDSYEFAKDKPLKLLNGGHLLALLQKNGRKAHIDIDEAKKIISEK